MHNSDNDPRVFKLVESLSKSGAINLDVSINDLIKDQGSLGFDRFDGNLICWNMYIMIQKWPPPLPPFPFRSEAFDNQHRNMSSDLTHKLNHKLSSLDGSERAELEKKLLSVISDK